MSGLFCVLMPQGMVDDEKSPSFATNYHKTQATAQYTPWICAHTDLSFPPHHYTNCLYRALSIWEIARASKPLVLKYYNVIHHTCIYTICILHDNYCTRLTQNPIQHWDSHPCYLSYRTICYNTRWCQGIYLHPEPQSPILRPHINKALTFRINLNYKFRNLSSLEI